MKKRPENIPSFTLIETLMTSIIALIIIAMTSSFFLNMVVGKQQHAIQQEIQYNLQFALHQITQEIKESTGIDQAQSVLNSHPGKLQLKNDDPIADPTVISSNGSNLTMTRGIQPELLLLTNKVHITNLSFSYSEPNNSSGTVIGNISIQSNVDQNVSLSESFSVNFRAPQI